MKRTQHRNTQQTTNLFGPLKWSLRRLSTINLWISCNPANNKEMLCTQLKYKQLIGFLINSPSVTK